MVLLWLIRSPDCVLLDYSSCLALVGPLLGVDGSDVVGEVAAGLEHFITVTTLQPGPAVSTGDMVPGE